MTYKLFSMAARSSLGFTSEPGHSAAEGARAPHLAAMNLLPISAAGVLTTGPLVRNKPSVGRKPCINFQSALQITPATNGSVL